MNKQAQASLISLASRMTEVSASTLNPTMLGQALVELSGIAKKLHRFAYIMCEQGLTERQEASADKLEARVEAIFKEINANMPTSVFVETERKAHFIPEIQRGDPRYATIKVWHEHFESDRTPGDDNVRRGCEVIEF